MYVRILIRCAVISLGFSGLAACSPSAHLDCSGDGEVDGVYEDANYGRIEFKHGIFIPSEGLGTMLFTDDPTLVDAMRRSPDPLSDGPRLASMIGKSMVGFEYDQFGSYKQRIVVGKQQGSGWSGADSGSYAIDETGCARGHADLDADDWGVFAVPKWVDPGAAAMNPEDVPVEAGGSVTPTPMEMDEATASPDDALALWAKAWDRLHLADPAQALQATGLSSGAATAMADNKAMLAMLERVRQQCADPATAQYDTDYDEITGPSPTIDGFTFKATVRARADGDSAVIENCYVMFRNDQSLEQCWPMQQDCRTAPVFRN